MIEKPSYQLSFGLELEDPTPADPTPGPTPADPTQPSPYSANMERAMEEAARREFEAGGVTLEWREEYEALMRGGWPFRVGMYIAWAASPRKGRKPEGLQELAELMGLTSPRAIHTWRARNKVIDAQVAAMQAAPLFQHRADVVQALVDSASTTNYKNNPDRRLFFQLTGELSEDVNLKVSGNKMDLKNLTDAQLAELAGTLTTEPAGWVHRTEKNREFEVEKEKPQPDTDGVYHEGHEDTQREEGNEEEGGAS